MIVRATCRRALVLQSFSGNHDLSDSPNHSCCDICQRKCLCSSSLSSCAYQCGRAELGTVDEANQPRDESESSDEDTYGHSDKDRVRHPTPEELCELEKRLFQLRNKHLSINDVPLYVGGDIASGLPVHAIESVLNNVSYISEPQDLEDLCFVFDHSEEIMDIIVNVCD